MDPTTLQAATGCTAVTADQFAAAITDCMDRFGIDTPERQAAFLAQVAHESGRLRYVRELASGQAYEGRADLGNTERGDGQRFKGRGLLQTTGRKNYSELQSKLEEFGYTDVPDFAAEPMRLEEPEWAAASAGLYWATRHLNQYADSGDFITLTKRINGGLNGYEDRCNCWSKAKDALC